MKFKLFKKKFLLTTLVITTFVSFSAVSVSCNIDSHFKKEITSQESKSVDNKIGKKLNQEITIKKYKEDDKSKIIDVKTTYWQKFGYIEGTVIKVFDGDTYLLEYEKDGEKKQVKIRCWGLDTPETRSPNVPNVSEIEQKYSDLDTEHAKSLILNQKVRTILLHQQTYDREVGITFFGKNFEECFEYRMLKDGYTLPRFTKENIESWKLEFNKKQKDSIASLFLKDFAYATNYAVLKRLGFYKDFKTPEELQRKVFLSHGDVISTFMFLPSLLENGYYVEAEDNIFLFLDKHKTNNK
ncbi:thermonuclease family protein [Mycoplasma miroungirhinis]|uniref:TNase-like domain-containing protein n=1 Tax=Mycoplasma miroungirhinis TaxID=754516 RepID=A0A6M4JBL4_9MOLU|nr:thermonuclease family protein [Mycoplasma miroungirhinis]QJR44310.1 hypothetical protein HLA92_02620 [Mycoplasma miroungirhinis]